MTLLRDARRQLGPALTALEVMWPDYHDFVTGPAKLAGAVLDGRHACYALVEMSGQDQDADQQRLETWLVGLLGLGVIGDAHGVGRTKRAYLPISRTEADIAWMRRLKLLFDPNAILNMGRVV